jgi:hypothetical protein
MQRGRITTEHGAWFLRFYEKGIIGGRVSRRRVCIRLAPHNEEFPDKRSVELLAEKILAPHNARQVQPESSQMVAEFIELRYLPFVKSKLRPSTYKDYQDVFRVHVKDRLGDVRLRDFRTVHAQRP